MSNLIKRILVGLVGIPLIIYICYSGGIIFLIFSLLVTSIALWEFYSMFEEKGYRPMKELGILTSDAVLVISYFMAIDFIFFEFLFLILLITAEVIRKENHNPVNPVIVIFGLLYITAPFVMLRELAGLPGLNLVIYIFVLIWACDTAAYFAGRFFGKHKLSAVSPNKTWEGSVAGFLFTIIVSLVVHFTFPDKISFNDSLVTGLIIGIFSQVGDLFESMIKRYCGVKDSSELIPGHGGILDRFDSLIFVTPLVFIYFVYIK